ncbi:MAG: heavy metal-associated domain-containing protein [Pseudomonadota bacterium]
MTSTTAKTYSVTGMDCAGCAANLEKGIGRLDGVNAVKIDFMSATVSSGSSTLVLSSISRPRMRSDGGLPTVRWRSEASCLTTVSSRRSI